MSANSPYKRGLVKENDPANARSRVEFPDEDGVVSFWMSWPSGAAGASKFYSQPDVGSQVHCLVDWKGEDGLIVATAYSKQDAPPTADGTKTVLAFEGGLTLTVDKASGGMTLTMPQGLVIQAETVTITGDIETTGALRNNGKDVGSTHRHTDVMPGTADSGTPK